MMKEDHSVRCRRPRMVFRWASEGVVVSKIWESVEDYAFISD